MNKNVSYHNIPGEEGKDIRDAWTRAIARPVLPKAVRVCSDNVNKDSFDEPCSIDCDELMWRLLTGNLKYILKNQIWFK